MRGQLIRTVKVANDKEGLKNPKGKKKKPSSKRRIFSEFGKGPTTGQGGEKSQTTSLTVIRGTYKVQFGRVRVALTVMVEGERATRRWGKPGGNKPYLTPHTQKYLQWPAFLHRRLSCRLGCTLYH